MILQCGDCLELMRDIPDHSVDMVLCDLPYGVLNKNNPHAHWDNPISMDDLWNHYRRVCKDNAAIVLFGQGMFTADLMKSNPRMWRYNLIWKKGNRPTGFLDANRRPLRLHEDILVFYAAQPTYHPQFSIGNVNHKRGGAGNGSTKNNRNGCYGKFQTTPTVETNKKYPTSIIDIAKEHPQTYHATQKPVALLKWLIRTYTNEGDTVMDNCMGSGSTGVACVNTGRDFIGIEIDPDYFMIAQSRIREANDGSELDKAQTMMEDFQ